MESELLECPIEELDHLERLFFSGSNFIPGTLKTEAPEDRKWKRNKNGLIQWWIYLFILIWKIGSVNIVTGFSQDSNHE